MKQIVFFLHTFASSVLGTVLQWKGKLWGVFGFTLSGIQWCENTASVKESNRSCCWTPSTAQSSCYLHSRVKPISHFPVHWHNNSYGCNEQWCDVGITEELKTGLLDETALPACQPSSSGLVVFSTSSHEPVFISFDHLWFVHVCHFESDTVDAECLFQPVGVTCKGRGTTLCDGWISSFHNLGH